MKILYMGTPEIAAVILQNLIANQYDIIGVVTQPDKPKGRGKAIGMSEVKVVALENAIPVYQPLKMRDEEFQNSIKELNPDIIVVAAFGKILPKFFLELPKYGCVNVHASLLPKYRGSAPIEWSIIDGEEKTGVTIIQMDEGIDTGDMFYKIEVPISKEETGGSLREKLAIAGSEALLTTLKQIEEGTAKKEKQKDELSNYVKMLEKNMGDLDFSKKAIELERLVRGLNPWPSAYTHFEGKTFKIWSSKVAYDKDLEVIVEENKKLKNLTSVPVGTLVAMDKESIFIKTAEGLLRVYELQLEGKKRMNTADFLRGNKVEVGYQFT